VAEKLGLDDIEAVEASGSGKRPSFRPKSGNSEQDFLGKHAKAGVSCVLTNDTKVKGKIVDWDQYHVLMETSDGLLTLIRKAAVRYYVAPATRKSPAEPEKPSMNAAKHFLDEAIEGKTPMTFVFANGKVVTAIVKGHDSYNVLLGKENLEILLPKHSFLYAYQAQG